MSLEKATISVPGFDFRKVGIRLWVWIGVLTLIVWTYPVAYRTTRLLTVIGFAVLWAGAFYLWRRKKIITVLLISIALFALGLVSLPNRPVQMEALARDYCKGLRFFRGVRYVWGGEGLAGIDCSGLVRQGLIWGEVLYGIRTCNGQPIRDALWLWWHDCSAKELGRGFEGLTRERFKAKSIMGANAALLKKGDLAVTDDGIHVMAYLGNRTWIEADPVVRKVVEVTLPSDNPWFQAPVIFVRWRWLDPN